MIRFALDNGQSIHSSVNGLQGLYIYIYYLNIIF